MNPIHRVNAQIFTIAPIDEEQLYEDVKKLYKTKGVISTQMIRNHFDVDFKMALKLMSRVISEDS